jgi:hypothetical protein
MCQFGDEHGVRQPACRVGQFGGRRVATDRRRPARRAANRRGDCKARTALLLAMLHKLGIDAAPVAVSINAAYGVEPPAAPH